MRSSPPQIDVQNLLSIINNNGGDHIAEQERPSLSTILPELKQGDNVLLEIEFGNAIKVVKSLINGKEQDFPLSLNLDKSLKLENGNKYDIAAEIVKNGQKLELKLVSINNKSPEKFILTTNKEVKNSSGIPLPKTETAHKSVSLEHHAAIQNKQAINIPVSPLKIINSVEVLAKKMYLPKVVVERIYEELSAAQVNMSLTSIMLPNQDPPSIVNNIIDVIKELIRQPEAKPLIELSKNVIGTKVMGEVIEREGLPTIVRTPLGDVLPQIPIRLEPQSKVVLDIVSIFKPRFISAVKDPFLEIIKPLQQMKPEIYEQVLDRIPQVNVKILSNLVHFVTAAKSKDVSLWLGQKLTEQIQSQGQEGKDIVLKLGDFMNNVSVKENAGWRIIEIPFFNGEVINKIKVATKKTEDEENHNDRKEKRGVRFVVDTDFSQLGSFQFDGYSIEKEKRFDLIVRTQKNLGEDILSNIIKIFKTSLHNVDYVGNVKISMNEHFINVYEEDTSPRNLANGIYI